MFILCVGATLLDFTEKYGLIKYWYRRFIKVVLPLISWNIISYFYRVYVIKNLPKQRLTFRIIWDLYFLNKINPIFKSFRFFLLTYMIIPLLAYVDKSKKIKTYTYCFITLIITQSLIPYLINMFHANLSWPYTFNPGYIIYIFPGYIIQNYKFNIKIKVFIYAFGFIALIIHLFGTQILTLRYKRIIQLHKGYFNLPCIVYSCSTFLFIKEYSYCITKIINRKYINIIGSLTIGPFFLHNPKLIHLNMFYQV